MDDHGVGDDGDRGADDGVDVCDLYDAGCVWVVKGAGKGMGCRGVEGRKRRGVVAGGIVMLYRLGDLVCAWVVSGRRA